MAAFTAVVVHSSVVPRPSLTRGFFPLLFWERERRSLFRFRPLSPPPALPDGSAVEVKKGRFFGQC